MTAPKYRGTHQKLRRLLLPGAYGKNCARCGLPLLRGQPLDLDHEDNGTGNYLGFSHRSCNRRAGALLRRPWKVKLMHVAVGVEVSQDRLHTSVVTAGAADDGTVAIHLHYLDGPHSAVEVVEGLDAEVLAVVIDLHGPTANLAGAFRDVFDDKVLLPSGSEYGVACAAFRDELDAGRIRHDRQAELTNAVRHAELRPSEGAERWRRRGTIVDISPVIAASLACWGWENTDLPEENYCPISFF